VVGELLISDEARASSLARASLGVARREWQNGAIYYYALEVPGSTVQGMFDAAGTVTHRYRYLPFGEPLPSSSSAVVNPLRFAARELGAATGLYYVRARWSRVAS
jgi:hypothetical protein